MPYKPKKPCAYPSCHRLTNSRYCEEHAKQVARHYNKYGRDPATRKLYGRTWQKIRAALLSTTPLCEQCKDAGKLTPATEVHHIIPLSKGGTNDTDNLMSLCKSCHSEITARESGRW